MPTRFLLFLCFLFLFGNACTAESPAPAQPDFRPTATIKDIMDSIVDPNADEIWGAVSWTVDATGLHERYPQNDEEWKAVRRKVISLLEASNLLLVPGRHVARPHEKSENPGIELEPEQMEVLINQDKETFYKLAHALHDSVMIALEAVEAKDKEALLNSGDAIDRACENCHVKYWYPNEAKNQEEQRQVPAPPRNEADKK